MLQYCWMMGGYLAELATQQEEYAVQQYLPAGNHYWIGLNDQAQEGENQRTDKICDIGVIITPLQATGPGLTATMLPSTPTGRGE